MTTIIPRPERGEGSSGYLRTLKICAAVPVVDELHNLRAQSFRHGSRVLVEDETLVFNAQAVVLVILDGERTVRIRKVVGSIPIRSTILKKNHRQFGGDFSFDDNNTTDRKRI